MSTTHYNFSEIEGSQNVDLVNAINTPLQQIDTTIYNNSVRDGLTEVVIYGDSWTDTSVEASQWSSRFATISGLNVHNYAHNGATITTALSNNIVNQQVSEMQSDNAYDHNRVGLVLILGGINDKRNNGKTYQQVGDALISTWNKTRQICPNAHCYYMNNFEWPYTTANAKYWSNLEQYLCNTIRLHTINVYGEFMPSAFNTSNWYHLLVDSNKQIANIFYSNIFGGSGLTFIPKHYVSQTYNIENGTVQVAATWTIDHVAHIVDFMIVVVANHTATANVALSTAQTDKANMIPFSFDLTGSIGDAFQIGVLALYDTTRIAFACNNLKANKSQFFFRPYVQW